MKILAPISTIMTTDLVTLLTYESLVKAKDLFEKNNIHHIPVINSNKIIGVLSKSDLLYFMRAAKGRGDELIEAARLRSWRVEEIMCKAVFTLQKNDTIIQALDIFKNNQIHCIPILDGETLVGMITPHDIVLQVRKEGMQMVDKLIIQ